MSTGRHNNEPTEIRRHDTPELSENGVAATSSCASSSSHNETLSVTGKRTADQITDLDPTVEMTAEERRAELIQLLRSGKRVSKNCGPVKQLLWVLEHEESSESEWSASLDAVDPLLERHADIKNALYEVKNFFFRGAADAAISMSVVSEDVSVGAETTQTESATEAGSGAALDSTMPASDARMDDVSHVAESHSSESNPAQPERSSTSTRASETRSQHDEEKRCEDARQLIAPIRRVRDIVIERSADANDDALSEALERVASAMEEHSRTVEKRVLQYVVWFTLKSQDPDWSRLHEELHQCNPTPVSLQKAVAHMHGVLFEEDSDDGYDGATDTSTSALVGSTDTSTSDLGSPHASGASHAPHAPAEIREPPTATH